MNRRSVLRGVPVATVLPLAGCLGTVFGGAEWQPTVDATTSTLSPGETAPLTVEATDVGGFQFVSPDADGIHVETSLDAVDVTPPPDSGNDSSPPQWFWSSRTDVTVETTVTVDDSVEPGDYRYGVRVFPGDHADSERVREFVVTVVAA